MGNSLSNVIKGVVGDSDDDKGTRDTLNALYELGKSRTEVAYAQAIGGTETIYAPISKVILRKQKIVANTETNIDKIIDGIKGGIGDLIQGQILDGVATIVKEGLNVVLGESSGRVSSENTYALIATDIGALMRVDVDVYNFETSTTRLQTTAKNVTAITMLVSSVKLEALSANDIRAIVSLKYSSVAPAKQQEIYDLVLKAYIMDKDGGPTPEALAEFRKMFKPSELEDVARRNGHLGSISEEAVVPYSWPPKSWPKAGLPSASASIKGDKESADPTDLKIEVVAILCAAPTPRWAQNMVAFMAMYLPTDGSVTSTGVPTELSGTAVTFGFKVGAEKDFANVIKTFQDAVLPAVSRFPDLVSICASLNLQYA